MIVTYRTTWNRFKAGKLPNAYKDEFGNVLLKIDNDNLENYNKVAIYVRVSSNENKSNLTDRLKQSATAKDYQIIHIVKEVGSGINDNRPKLLKLLKKDNYGILLVEHKDRLTRFGFKYIKTLIDTKKIKIEELKEKQKK